VKEDQSLPRLLYCLSSSSSESGSLVAERIIKKCLVW